MLSGRTLPSRLQVLAERLASQGITATESYPQEDAIHDSEEGVREPSSEWRTPLFGIRSRAETRARRLSSESEAGPYST